VEPAADNGTVPYEVKGSEATWKADEIQTSRKQPPVTDPQSRNTVENREIVYDKQNNKKVEGPKHAAEDHHGSATGPGSDISILSECSALDKLEKTSQTVKGANAIIEDSEALSTALSPIKIWLSNTSTSPRYICQRFIL
jgi:fused-like protein